MKNKMFGKIVCILMVLSVIFCFASCGDSENNNGLTDKPASESMENNEKENDTATQKFDKELLVDADIFTAYIPEYWENKVSYEIKKLENDDSFLVYFQHDKSYANDFGGHIFSLEVHHSEEGYAQMLEEFSPTPYELVGYLNTAEGKFEVIVTYPSDQQFDNKYKNEYKKITESIDEFVSTITADNGATFEKK